MKKMRILAAMLMAAFAPALMATAGATPQKCGEHGNKNTMVVSTAWLGEHLHDPNVVVLAVGQKSDYDKGHIPGSVFADYHETHQMQSPAGLSVELLPPDEFVKVFEKFGVTNDSHIILYQAKDWFSPTARVYMTLDAMGFGARTSVLDGGFLLWSKEGRPVSTEDTKVTKTGTITPCPTGDVVTDIGYVRANMHHAGVAIVDARNEEFYTGKTQPNDQRRGHIPGAGSLPHTSLEDADGKLKSTAELQALFSAAGVKAGDRVVSYCHIGQQASAVYFVARYLGYDARLFDGSWEQWSGRKDLPAETSPGAAPVKQ
jgi:thiosulfate/3-mercaptopyruvate sulfurtransferase